MVLYTQTAVCVCVIAMKEDRKRLKVEKSDLVNQMQQLYTTLESREEQLRDFIRNYDQHRKVPTHTYTLTHVLVFTSNSHTNLTKV